MYFNSVRKSGQFSRCFPYKRRYRSTINCQHKKSCIPKSFFSTTAIINNKRANSEEESGGYNLTVRQRKALKLVNDQYNQPNDINNNNNNSNSDESFDVSKLSDISQALKVLKEQAEIQEMEAYENNPQPWFNLLTFPSRALWRSSPQLPPTYLTDVQMDIMKRSERTSKQLRRTIENIVLNQMALSEKRERERRDMVNGKRGERSSDTPLSTNNKKSKKGKIKPVYYNPEQTVSSLKYRLVPNYHITKRILREVQGLIGRENFQPKKVLDVGIGVGSSSAALLDHFFERFMRENLIYDDDNNEDGLDMGMKPSYSYDGVEWIHGIDPSTSMRDGANILLKSVMEGQQEELLQAQADKKVSRSPSKPRITLGETLSSAQDRNISKLRGTYDLALCSYTLCEIPSVPASLSMVAMIWEKLSPNGIAIFVEPGTPDGFNSLRSVRSMLLDCCPPTSKEGDPGESVEGDEECHVIAPCTHNGTCPMIRHQQNFRKKTMEGLINEATEIDDDIIETEIDSDDDWADQDINVPEDQSSDGDDEDDWDEDIIDFSSGSQMNSFDASESVRSSLETDAFDSAFCSFVHGLPGGEGGKRGEKFSYLVVQKRITDEYQEKVNEGDPFQDVDLVELLNASIEAGGVGSRKRGPKISSGRAKDEDKFEEVLDEAVDIERQYLYSEEDLLGLELVKGKYNSWGRIIRAPIKKKGHVIVDYCTSSRGDAVLDDENNEDKGRIVRRTITRSQSDRAAPGMYMASRKSRWGGLWPDIRE